MRPHGQLTARIAERLTKTLDTDKYVVLHDHGAASANRGTIISWFGKAGKPTQEIELSELGLAVVQKGTDFILLLVDIEESKDRPKTLLGDALGTLLGQGITFRGTRLCT
jgi:hypothetical protein